MSLDCLNDIILDDLAINIDVTNIKSWNLNTGLTVNSLCKWKNAFSDNIDLYDFGLTEFDVGRTNIMWDKLSITPKDNIFSMYRMGFNKVHNPTNRQTSGVTATTEYLPMSATSSTGGSLNFFDLNGGYLQGFFKLNGYNYELFPSRYAKGITIETLLYLYQHSSGIFFMMGTRAEDKYNPYFSGETMTGITTTGITTSLNNYLDSILEKQTIKKSFNIYEDRFENKLLIENPIENIKSNIIAFELTKDKHLAYKYIDNNGFIVTNKSNSLIENTGFTWITIVFTPNNIIDDPQLLNCPYRRTGKLNFYVNGRNFWVIKEFPELYFKGFANDKEKQIGVPYVISWGGGSFGLKNSWHYDFQTYYLYNEDNDLYIKDNFNVQYNPIPSECYHPSTGITSLSGLSLISDNTTFYIKDFCDPNIEHPITVMRIEFTGTTGNSYFIKYKKPISVLSNRDYTAEILLYDSGFFNKNSVKKVSILPYGDVDINIIDEIVYESGLNSWKNLKSVFRLNDNIGQQFINIGILIESDIIFNKNIPLFLSDFKYTASDILVQDERKRNLTIEQNFNSSFIGGIQKLRIYDNALKSTEVLHNISWEAKNNPYQNIKTNKGGRIIYR